MPNFKDVLDDMKDRLVEFKEKRAMCSMGSQNYAYCDGRVDQLEEDLPHFEQFVEFLALLENLDDHYDENGNPI